MSQQFSNTGIQDGLPVEASEISQSVDAFTGAKAYDVIISGSLTVTGSTPSAGTPGSIRLTGSLVNDGPGQFSHVGVSTAVSPSNGKALHIVGDAAGGFDPIVKIESDTANSRPQIKFSNEDTDWAIRAGVEDLFSFEIFQSSSQGQATGFLPFVSDAATADYTLYLLKSPSVGQEGNIGIGLGAGAEALLNNMNYTTDFGNLRAASYITGSVIRSATKLSASAAGVNIHGTASHANYHETSPTGSYAKSTLVDFSYNIDPSTSPNNNSQINAIRISSTETGSLNHIKIDANDVTFGPFGEGLYIGDEATNNYNVVISGSNEIDQGVAWIGNPNDQYIRINSLDDQMKFAQSQDGIGGGAQTVILGVANNTSDARIKGTLKVSGSSTPTLTQDGFDSGTLVQFASMSLDPNELKFNVNNQTVVADNQFTARLMNQNTGNLSKLSFSAGGGGSNTNHTAFHVSKSKDTEMYSTLNFGNMVKYPEGSYPFAKQVHAYMSLNWGPDDGQYNYLGNGWEGRYVTRNFTTSQFSNETLIQISGNTTTDPSGLRTKDKTIFVECEAIGITNGGDGVYLRRPFVYHWDDSANVWVPIENTAATTRLNSNVNFNFSNFYSSGNGTDTLTFYLQAWTSITTDWAGWINIKTSSAKYTPM